MEERHYGFKPNYHPNAPPPPNPHAPWDHHHHHSPPPHHHHGHPPNQPHPPPSSYHNEAGYRWVDTSAYGSVPSTALHGGVDIDGHQIYVGRAFHEGDWIPAKVIPGKSVAYVAYDGHEFPVDRFQVLCEQRFDWVPTNGGHIPFGAVQGGRTSDGEELYIGRVQHENSKTVGKVHPSHGVCYIPFNGKEIPYESYEILVLRG